MLSSLSLSGGTIALADSGAIAALAGVRLAFDVEEDEMLVSIEFKSYAGGTLAATGNVITYALGVDGAVPGAAIGAMFCGLAGAPLEFKEELTLSKGTHVVSLYAAEDGTDGVVLNHATFPLVLKARRLSNEGVLAHGVNAKDKGIF